MTQGRQGTDRFDVRDRVSIVTGGGRGIGAALALGLSDAGAKVVVAGRSSETCSDAVRAIERRGGTAVAVPTDVGLSEAREHLVNEAMAAFGRLDVLVNNAGVLRPHDTVKVTEDEFDDVVRTNVKGPVFLSRQALPYLAADAGGSIINISALGAFQTMPGLGAYCAAKAAMVNWTSTMAKEWAAQRVRVNLVVPGPVATDMILPRDDTRRATFVSEMAAKTLIGRLAEPDDLVAAVLFLASDASSFMTGRSLFLDGGMLV